MWRVLRPDSISVLDDKICKKSLRRYFDVSFDSKKAKFLVSKTISVEYSEDDPLSRLWENHSEGLEKFLERISHIDKDKDLTEIEKKPTQSLLDLKIHIAKRILQNCCLCERRCKINRVIGDKGFCRCGNEMAVSTFFEHMGEEPELIPSGTIFTCGCTLRCIHCQNWTISQWIEKGTVFKPSDLASIIKDLRLRGCRNINLVGGDPTSWLPMWLDTLNLVDVNVPVVWNSNSYYSWETRNLLKGFVDLYLLDFKYGPGSCSDEISSAPNYWEVATQNHLEAQKWGELIIRILVLPTHLDCCFKPIIDWIVENLGREIRVNIMFQYHPEWRAHENKRLTRCLNDDEKRDAIKYARQQEMRNFIT